MIIRENIEFKRTSSTKGSLGLGRIPKITDDDLYEMILLLDPYTGKPDEKYYEESWRIAMGDEEYFKNLANAKEIWNILKDHIEIALPIKKKFPDEMLNFIKKWSRGRWVYDANPGSSEFHPVFSDIKLPSATEITEEELEEKIEEKEMEDLNLWAEIQESLEFQRTGDTKKSLKIGGIVANKDPEILIDSLKQAFEEYLYAYGYERDRDEPEGLPTEIKVFLKSDIKYHPQTIFNKIGEWIHEFTPYEVRTVSSSNLITKERKPIIRTGRVYYIELKKTNEALEFKKGKDTKRAVGLGKYKPGSEKDFDDVEKGDIAKDYYGDEYIVINKIKARLEKGTKDFEDLENFIRRYDNPGGMGYMLTDPEDYGYDFGDEIELIAVKEKSSYTLVFTYGDDGAIAIW